ncbi:hypothetical protein UPYG_G00036590 [Umbra pygmaea]|uniref:Coiled-coil domain-containing protein 181 n=1 Tax=Umbra pygmaea TaxID=75934 RepID=A0ABD0YB02_UMBPY
MLTYEWRCYGRKLGDTKLLVVNMSQVVTSTRTQEEYEDDFEKDLDWLISEEEKSDGQEPDYEDIEAKIDKELEGAEKECGENEDKNRQKQTLLSESKEPEERWPSPMEPLEFDPERESPNKGGSPTAPPPPALEDELVEEKKYILEKIQVANQQLQDQEAPDMMRHRRLHFKETLVDLVVPPLEYNKNNSANHWTGVEEQEDLSQANGKNMEVVREVSGRLSDLKISHQESGGERKGPWTKAVNGAVNEAVIGGLEVNQIEHGREGRVLVEKDGKFDLISLKEMEGHGLMLPPLASYPSDNTHMSPQPSDQSPSKSPSSSLRPISSTLSLADKHLRFPRPPARNRPSSAGHGPSGSGRRAVRRRVQSANSTPSQLSTFTLSPQQKELLSKAQARKERLAREEEQRKREEEVQKRQENESAFRAWLGRKREQLQEDRRIQRAQEMERVNAMKEHSDPDEAFQSWLQRKQEQQQRERHLQEMRRLEEESGFYLHDREECERAFKRWLKRKWAEKRVEQQAARERARRLVYEERRARRMQDLMCSVNEAMPFRFTEHLAYHF